MLEEIAAPEMRYSRFKVVCVEGFTRDNLPGELVTLSRGGKPLITRSLEDVGELQSAPAGLWREPGDYQPPAKMERLPVPLTKAELEDVVVTSTVPLARIVFFGRCRQELRGTGWKDASGGAPQIDMFTVLLEDATPEEDAEGGGGGEPEAE